MIRVIDGLPGNVVGFEAVGEVRANDYQDTLDPVIQTALESHDKLRLLYVLGDDFDGYSGGAMWEDAKVGIGNWTAWEKIAIVTDTDWVEHGIKAFGWMLPGEVKVYDDDQLEDAKKWASE
ncbi:MAG: STAS/SEC14 domain-containing protein [Acidimicrobiia bacterium]